ncbi:molecular chaperone (small heat shock protein) [Desulfocapsa sulfexigens DSM 10523]|uniref:Molecular chaperone (Small heat shock protein) n=1 Tax=Desulfocapsa sulfexigens (strain DSM 10523 / SB164P1) TaxID=1167006 RepID=M1PDG8_DESSD|nr:Hsp20/alpha crystallin family protein [Desulfocapsa sulfexigens]AGF77780.1 molecular chaperone (small heat shock protein) [Desulfocapsa sulfexigens DSM 10523]
MWTRMNDIDRMFSAMDLLRSINSDRSYGESSGWRVAGGFPKTNMYDNGDSFQMIAEVPGVNKEDLNIRIQGNYLEISGTRKSDAPEGYKTHRVERNLSTFTRSFTLAADVDADKIDAVLKDGLLTLVLPKAESAKPKQITIN